MGELFVTIDLDMCVARAREAALLAWEVIEPFYQGSFKVYEKCGEGPATDADIAADHAILGHLTRHFPRTGFGYLTEETEKDPARFAHDYCWIVDPIDGTREFIAGRDDFAIQIGLAGRTAPHGPMESLAGVVYMPRTATLYSARRDGGTWAETPGDPASRRRLFVHEVHELSQARMVITRQQYGRRMTEAIERLGVREVYHLGSLGVKVVEVVEGRAALYINTGRKGCKEWDVCAPAVILEEAGGRITELDGRLITYNNKDFYVHNGLLASNGYLHDAAMRVIGCGDLS